MKLLLLSMLLLCNFCIYSNDSLTKSNKLYIASSIWSEVKYNFVFYHTLKFDWDSVYHKQIETITKNDNIESDYEFYLRMRKWVAMLNDSHTNFYLPDSYYEKRISKIGVNTKLIDSSLIITRIIDSTLKNKIEPGDEIININGMNVHSYVNKYVKPYVSSSTKQDRNIRCYYYETFFGPTEDSVTLKISNKNNELLDLVCSRDPIFINGDSENVFFSIEYSTISSNTGYLKINDFSNEKFTEIIDSIFKHNQVVKLSNLIIDLRHNNGGDSYNAYYLLQKIAKKKFYGSYFRTRDYKPAFRAWGMEEGWYFQYAEKIKNKKKGYKNNACLLISNRTFSAAEDFCMPFKQMKRGLIIGEKTAGSTGQPLFMKFVDGSALRICTLEDMYADQTKFVGVGISPDIVIKETRGDIYNQKDRVLDSTVKIIINEKF